MQLSEAIMLGSTLLRPKQGCLYISSTITGGRPAGCALGMAAVAYGIDLEAMVEGSVVHFEGPAGAVLGKVAKSPCGCQNSKFRWSRTVGAIIMHLFDTHVMSSRDWTFEQLVDWVHQQEPKALPAAQVVEEEVVAVG